MAALNSICVIDDDLIYQFAVKLSLRQLQLADKVLTFANGDQAKTYFIENYADATALPDVILLDINMPIMDGWDFLEWFQEIKGSLSKKIPIFMVSSSIDWRDIERAKGFEDVLDYVSKPLTDGNFYEIVQRISQEA